MVILLVAIGCSNSKKRAKTEAQLMDFIGKIKTNHSINYSMYGKINYQDKIEFDKNGKISKWLQIFNNKKIYLVINVNMISKESL